jgi:CheY-like chemotaxis protein
MLYYRWFRQDVVREGNRYHRVKNMAGKKKVLIVEDEVMLEELIRKRLEFEGYEVISACDGKEGLLKALSDKPDLIMADLMMPEMDGSEMIRIIRGNSDLKDIPIIVISARGGKADIEKAKAEGANEYFVKPFLSDNLLSTLREYLK